MQNDECLKYMGAIAVATRDCDVSRNGSAQKEGAMGRSFAHLNNIDHTVVNARPNLERGPNSDLAPDTSACFFL